ncbi:probable sodium/metabolite cotransporter BASS2, chloroplastic isoform X4 [Quercus robur]|uniref:probable sodium/metabolite cotransporter BASS2, chloroplastic isoform X4 n=1 Tax=Quercus robur TaxID=38942 RepID=UPI002162F7D8|nr:probable sodium/metabolite cotransporter BASS2, chloroplastic isoform X4 [Quercus robur]
MSLYSRLSPFTSPPKTNQRISRVILTPKTPTISFPPKPTNLLTITAVRGKPRWENLLYTAKPRTLPIIRAVNGNSEHSPVTPAKPSWENFLATAASLYPLYVIVGWFVACVKPSTFAWFVSRGPASYSLTLGLIMLAMGLTLEFKDMIHLFLQRPLSVTLIARGDVPLSIIVTACTTLGAVLLTPFLTKILAGTLVPVDAIQLSISTLQVVVAPILLGAYIQSAFPAVVKIVTPFAPLFAVLASSLLACSVFSENIVLLNSMVGASLTSDLSPLRQAQAILSGDLGVVMLAVALLHYVGFFVGYISAAICGFKEPQRRSISIEVGMQNSSLGVVLATSHFSSPMVAVPPAVSAVVMNVMGSSLGFLWRYKNPSDSESRPKIDDK